MIFPAAFAVRDTVALAVQIVNLAALRPPLSIRTEGADRQQNVSVGIARPLVVNSKIVSAERRLAILDERLEMWGQYEKYKPIRQKLDKVKPGRREQYQQEHRAELAAFDTAADFLKQMKESGEKITPKAWRAEAARLTAQKDFDYQKMRDMREDIKAVENLRKTADRLAREGQHQQKET